MRWISDGISGVEVDALSILGGLAPRSLPIARALAGWAWLTDDVTEVEASALATLYEFTERSLPLARRVAELPSLVDHLSAEEVDAIDSWSLLALSDVVLATWVMELAEQADDLVFAQSVAELPWVADGLHGDDTQRLAVLGSLASQDVKLARTVVEYQWLADSVSEDEIWAVHWLTEIAEQDVALAQAVAEMPWLADEISEDEKWAVLRIRGLSVEDVALARYILEKLWLADSVSEDERWAVRSLHEIAERDVALARTIAELPWLADSVSEHESLAVGRLLDLLEQDVALARTATEFVWLSHSPSDFESWALADLTWLAENDVELARAVVAMPSVTSGPPRVATGVISSSRILRELGLMDDLAQSTWYADGQSDEDLVLFSTLGTVANHSRSLYNDLLQSYEVKSRTITLPLAGEVRLWAFDPTSFREGEDPLRVLEEVARVSEAFISAPFPASDVIVVTSYGNKYGDGVWHVGQFMYVARGSQALLWAPPIYHEVGHYYFTGGIGPSWLVEGGATFIEALVRDAIGVETLEERRRHARRDMEQICYADDVRNIQQLNARQSRLTTGRHVCNYHMGVHLLIMLILTLGEQTTSSALRDLYVQHHTTGLEVTEEEIYRAFLKHTPPELESAFRALYKRLHGGTYDEEGG